MIEIAPGVWLQSFQLECEDQITQVSVSSQDDLQELFIIRYLSWYLLQVWAGGGHPQPPPLHLHLVAPPHHPGWCGQGWGANIRAAPSWREDHKRNQSCNNNLHYPPTADVVDWSAPYHVLPWFLQHICAEPGGEGEAGQDHDKVRGDCCHPDTSMQWWHHCLLPQSEEC